jgi:hypothetical protein
VKSPIPTLTLPLKGRELKAVVPRLRAGASKSSLLRVTRGKRRDDRITLYPSPGNYQHSLNT